MVTTASCLADLPASPTSPQFSIFLRCRYDWVTFQLRLKPQVPFSEGQGQEKASRPAHYPSSWRRENRERSISASQRFYLHVDGGRPEARQGPQSRSEFRSPGGPGLGVCVGMASWCLTSLPPHPESPLYSPWLPQLWVDAWGADKVVRQSYYVSPPMMLIAVALASLTRDPFWGWGGGAGA